MQETEQGPRESLTTAAATDSENTRRGSAQTPAAINHANMLAEHSA